MKMQLRAAFAALIASLALAACGLGRGEEDFAVTVEAPAARVESALDGISASGQFAELFPGVKAQRTRPSPGEILYTMPGTGDFPAQVRFRIVAVGGTGASAKGSVVHVAVDVPPVRTAITGQQMVLSETKVEHSVKALLEMAAAKLGRGERIDAERQQLSELFFILGVITDKEQLGRAETLRDNPAWVMGGSSWLDGMAEADAETPDVPLGDSPEPASNPDERLNANRRAEQSRLEAAAEPEDDTSGESTQPEAE